MAENNMEAKTVKAFVLQSCSNLTNHYKKGRVYDMPKEFFDSFGKFLVKVADKDEINQEAKLVEREQKRKDAQKKAEEKAKQK